MIAVIPYPHFDPVAVWIWHFPIRWYALAYISGLLIGWRYCVALAKKPPAIISTEGIDDLLVWVTFGVVLGGRTGYVLFYKPGYYLQNPSDIVALWHGGMSFHGGCAGVVLALWLYCRRHKVSLLGVADIVACAVPIGLFFGRIANFVNGELFGRPSNVPWAMVFPNGGPEPRHPSELYQATLEGIVLFLVLFALERRGARWRPGLITGAFLIGYAIARTIGELFRQPDEQLGYLLFGVVTMGQILSLPMLAAGAWMIWRARNRPPLAA